MCNITFYGELVKRSKTKCYYAGSHFTYVTVSLAFFVCSFLPNYHADTVPKHLWNTLIVWREYHKATLRTYILFSCVVCKNVKSNIYNTPTTVLPVVMYGCETLVPYVEERNVLMVFRCWWEYFNPETRSSNRLEWTAEIEALCSPHILRWSVNEVGGTCSTHGERKNKYTQNFSLNTWGGGEIAFRRNASRRIILKLM
jgi:hypothetical protein